MFIRQAKMPGAGGITTKTQKVHNSKCKLLWDEVGGPDFWFSQIQMTNIWSWVLWYMVQILICFCNGIERVQRSQYCTHFNFFQILVGRGGGHQISIFSQIQISLHYPGRGRGGWKFPIRISFPLSNSWQLTREMGNSTNHRGTFANKYYVCSSIINLVQHCHTTGISLQILQRITQGK